MTYVFGSRIRQFTKANSENWNSYGVAFFSAEELLSAWGAELLAAVELPSKPRAFLNPDLVFWPTSESVQPAERPDMTATRNMENNCNFMMVFVYLVIKELLGEENSNLLESP
jgi:hypothetical protein